MKRLILSVILVASLPFLLLAEYPGMGRGKGRPLLIGRGFAIRGKSYEVVGVMVRKGEEEELKGMLLVGGERYLLSLEKDEDGEYEGEVLTKEEGETEEVGEISLQVEETGDKWGKIAVGKLKLEGKTYRLYLLLPPRRRPPMMRERRRPFERGGEDYE